MYKKYFAILSALIVLLGNAGSAYALEISVSDNGSGSANEVNTQQESQTEVAQTNTSEVGNNVEISASTGENDASDNTGGDIAVETGDIASQTTVENSGNLSVADTGCCQSETDVSVNDNGANSENHVEVVQVSNVNTETDQNVKIQNNIQGIANTGDNSANDNTGGDVSIDTGNIQASSQVINGPVNTSIVQVLSGSGDVQAIVSGNGYDSHNILKAYIDNLTNSYTNSVSDIENNIFWDLNTGGNEANFNTDGDIVINTGDIDLAVIIKNLVNFNFTKIDCCNVYDPGDSNDDQQPPDIGGNEDNSGSSSGSDESSLSDTAAAGAGGPGLSGLSDTSGNNIQSIFFWFGMSLFTLGLKYLTEGLTAVKQTDSEK